MDAANYLVFSEIQIFIASKTKVNTEHWEKELDSFLADRNDFPRGMTKAKFKAFMFSLLNDLLKYRKMMS